MQLLNFAAIAIELFGAAFILIGLAAHLHYHWQNPQAIELKRFDRKLAAPIEAIAPAAESPVLLLPPANESHPFELSLEKMPALEPIAAVHQPAAALEPSTESLDVEPSIATDELSGLSIRELKALARDRQLKRYCNFTKAELIAALSA